MRRLKVSHITTYNYANPVRFGDHRMMFRPRDSHDLRILLTRLSITPKGAQLLQRNRTRKTEYLARRLGALGEAELAAVRDALPILERLLEAER